MYDYKFVQIQVGALTGKAKEDYEAIIREHAQEGWRLHTFAPLTVGAGGQATVIQIIFERKL